MRALLRAVRVVRTLVPITMNHPPSPIFVPDHHPPLQSRSTDMLVAASDIVDAVGPASLLTLEELSQIVPLLKKVFAEAEERREQRLERTAHEDFDDDEREALEDEQELEEGALDAAQELLSSALKAFKGAALPVVEALLPAIGRLLDQGRSHEERRIAIW